ncbi:MAG TPA: hypothetical protein VE011_03525 [Candidatus Dormibacteraeota bacterium]|nr:hypothetical protein [Candidatus Dormibacteraeota bacterium]
MNPMVPAVLGVLALVAALAILRSFGPRYRVGRLLATAPAVSVAEAVRLATSGEARYVRIDGRIDSEAEFEDADHRPLVLRRTTLEQRAGAGAWTTFESAVETVPFVIREGLDELWVDGNALAEGLIVIPRESVGRAADIGDRAPAGIDSATPVRLTIETVSSVEHGIVLGVPARAPDGRLVIGPGLGRPLVLTTLEPDEAMRVLTGGASARSRLAVACLVAGGVLIGAAALWWLIDAMTGGVATALATSPQPTLRPGGDTRTSGGGPGLVGDPGFAFVVVLGIALASIAGTLACVRATGGRRPRS